MPEFQDLQQRLSKGQQARDEAQRGLVLATDQIAQVDKRLRELARWSGRDDDRVAAERRSLDAKRRRLVEEQQRRGAALDRAKGELKEINPVFWDQWSDPRRNAGQMRDDIPVMLFPLRLETRFKTVPGRDGQQEQQQLWVRIYPDECLIDTFEEALSSAELDSAGIFWREYFRAAGGEADERAAWRALVASHGSGRATWIYRQYRPLNPLSAVDPQGDPALEMKPQSRAPGEVILVVSSEETLSAADISAMRKYWPAIWVAAGRADLAATALATLQGDVGAPRAAQIVEKLRPYNMAEKPPAGYTTETAAVSVAFLILPRRDDIDAKSRTWMQAASASLLPERFVLLGYRGGVEVVNQLGAPVQGPFSVSPDPAAAPEDQFQFDANGNLTVGTDLKWMTDFDEAVNRGMGFRVDLTPATAQGFDRLFVLGLRLSADAAKGKAELETLLNHHYFSRSGFALLPQGAATNNTEEGNSAYSREDDADSSYDFVFKGKAQFTETEELLDKSDGQWFAESLGIDAELLRQVPHAGGADQAEARAMNAALWPATLGYFMDTLLQTVFNDDELYYTRWFFSRFVSGRGMVPAIRIGRQPYGILPTSASSRMQWIYGDEKVSYLSYSRRFQEQRGTAFRDWLGKFKGVLDRLQGYWRDLAQTVAHVGATTGDPHQTLLDIVGLHPASVEFHQRYANTKQQEHNIATMWNMFVRWETLPANELHNEAYAVLAGLGYTRPDVPLLFDLFWKVTASRLNGPVIQEGPLSETDPLRAVSANNRNYIEWLREWARLSFDTIRLQDGFQGNKTPNALLYILLKHALELGYHDAGIRVLDDAQLLDPAAKVALRSEPHFFHVTEASVAPAAAGGAAPNRSRYEMLYSPSVQVTGDPRTLLVDHITRNIGLLVGTRYLAEQVRVLEKLERTPTARLERLLAEHLDCCTYRLDAWMCGLVNFQLASMRYVAPAGREGNENAVKHRTGIYLGAYGWLEDVRPENKVLTPVRLTDELDEIFNRQQPPNQNSPLVRDDQNEGYIHTPSVNHAVTAAILRNGYIANATPAQPDLLKVNLSSERVRQALGVIEGIRNGQNLAALLGYQFERGLHDRYNFAECDQFIYPLRLVFPLYTSQEELPDGVSIQSIEARNVVHGLNLIRHVKNAASVNKSYPFGFPDTKLPHASDTQRAAIDAEVNRLLDTHDALADLAMAESVHQVVMGNYDRAAATLDTYGQATFPPIPDVVQTPRSGITLTHRIGLQFETNVAVLPADSPRVKSEPALNKWLASILPDPGRVGCTVSYTDPVTGNPLSTIVTQAQVGLQPLDLLYVLNQDNLEARSELDDRIRDRVLNDGALHVRPDCLTGISYIQGAANDYSFFETAPFVRSLRALLLHSRPLRASDVAVPTDTKSQDTGIDTILRSRVDYLAGALTIVKDGPLATLRTQLEAALPDTGPVTATILANIDAYIASIGAACRDLALYGLPQTGIGAFQEARAGLFFAVMRKAAGAVKRWSDRLDEYDARMLTLPSITEEGARINFLLEIEPLVSTTLTDSTGLTSAQVLTIIQSKEVAFRVRRQAFLDLQETTTTTITGLLTAFQSLLPITDFDSQPLTTDEEIKQIVVIAQDTLTRTVQLIGDLEQRIGALADKLQAHDDTSVPDQRVQILTEAARGIFGDEFVLVPTFSMPDVQAAEWSNAYANRAALLDHQINVVKNPFPVDDWLYGAARVREKLHHLENLTFLTEAFGRTSPELSPIQLPYDATTPWMALDYPPEAKATLERELLLYTAHYEGGFDGTQVQCGLLLDEWTEVIPADTETTGLAFHFDKPSAEPPQTILLATPTQFRGAWQWDDLVATLHETLDLARLRAVEPAQLDKTELSVFLPATVLATTWQPITIAADLAAVNKYVSKMP
jgi:hypothetical protein